MHRIGKYGAEDSMSGLISDNYRILLVMSRFGIGLGVGNKGIGEVCRDNGVDTTTFLAVVNMVLDEDGVSPARPEDISLGALLSYLHNSHDYFLEFRLPAIRSKLAEVVGTGNDLDRAIVAYFDEYVAEVDRHMKHEEDVVFPYVRALLAGQAPAGYTIGEFSRHHDQVEARLTEFKNIIIKYYPAASTNEINGVLFDIFNCENDLASHNMIEDRLFVPAIEMLETANTAKR
ncbi:hemerythrin domain-containing protein [Alistipes sp. OttesenSCG-928-B03]|nr:hemerythrin domain-containing protein [Alistipes sp. OttesenSCG-928-B03]